MRAAGIAGEDMADAIAKSASAAGRAAMDQAKSMGASADEQVAAAGRAAAAWVESTTEMSRAQRAAGDAAANAAKRLGASVDEQRGAYARAVEAQAEYEASTRAVEDAQKGATAAATEASDRFVSSAASVARAAAEQAAAVGASADEQVSAAARAAVAFSDAAAEMSRAQKMAGDAAAETAYRLGLSVDEQEAAYGRAVEAQRAYEESTQRAAAVAEESAARESAAAKAAADASARQAEASAARTGRVSGAGAGFIEGATGVKASTLGLAGIGAAMYAGVKGATELQASMERVHTQAGAAQSQIKSLTTAVLNMAGRVGEAPNQLAQGLYHVVSSLNATLPAAQRSATELKVLQVAAEGARMGNADLVDVTNALDAAVVSGIRGVQNYRQAMGALNAAVGAGDMTMQDMADALGTGLLAKAKQAGLSLNQVSSAVAVLGDNNIRGAKAGTDLTSAIRIMSAPSEAAAEALGAVGLKATSLANAMRSGGLIGALDLLREKMIASGASASDMNLILTRAFGGRQSTGVSILLNQLDRLKAKFADTAKGADSFGSDVAANQRTLSQQMAELRATVDSLAEKFGMALIPKLQALGQAISSVISWFQKHDAAAKAMAAVIEGVLAGAVTTFAVNKAAVFVSGVGRMGKALLGFTTTTEAATASSDTSLKLIGTTAEGTEVTFTAAATGMGNAAEASAAATDAAFSSTGVGAVLVGLGVAVAELGTHWGSVMSGMKSAVNAMVEAAETALNALIGALNAAISVFNSTVGKLTGDIGKIGSVSVGGVFGNNRDMNAVVNAMNAGNGQHAMSSFMGHRMMQAIPGFEMSASGPVWERIASALAAKGFSKTAIAGILGNFAQENGGNSVTGISTSAGPGGIGFAQWIGSRATAERAYAKRYGLAPTNLEAEIGYLLQELHGNYKSAAVGVNKATTPSQAAQIFEKIFEGAGQPMMSHRIANANQAYKMLGGTLFDTGKGGSGRPGNISAALKAYLNKTTTTAAATSTIPVAVVTMLKTAMALEGTPYKWGGGHAGWDPVEELKKIGLDCSGFVSRVLHAGGVKLPGPLTTAGLAQHLAPGAGKYVTVYDRPTGPEAHTFMEIMGKWFMEGGNSSVNPSQRVIEMTKKQAEQEMAGGGFKAYHPIVGGPLATDKQLAAVGLSRSAAGANAGTDMQNLAALLQQQIAKAAETMIQTFMNVAQNGTVRTLEDTLGWGGGGRITATTPVTATLSEPPGSTLIAAQSPLQRIIERLGNTATSSQITKALSPTIGREEQGTPQGQKFEQEVQTLIASGEQRLAEKLVAAHRAAMQSLARELYAQQTIKDAESITLQATEEKDRTQIAADTAADILTITKAQYQAEQDALSAQTTVMKDQEQIVSDQARAQTQYVKDMTQMASDQFAAMAQSIKDQATIMSDQSKSVVDLINDQAQTQADTYGERGLYGLNLVAQQLRVQLDVMKTGYDQQIDLAQQQLDQLQAQANAAESSAQIQLDQVTTAQDQLVALAQQHLDTVVLKQDQLVAGARAHADAVAIRQDQKIAAAQQHADTVALQQDINVQLAQTAVDLSANASKSQQMITGAQLSKVTAEATKANNAAGANLTNVTDRATALISQAEGQYTNAQLNAAKAVQKATNAYTDAQDTATGAIQNAQSNLTDITGFFNSAIATAQANLSTIEGTASVQEAGVSSKITTTEAEASTQFAGSGLVVNITGIPTTDADAIASAIGWTMRTAIPS